MIAFDVRGLGGSDRGEGAITLPSMAEDVSALLEALAVRRTQSRMVTGLARRAGAGSGAPRSGGEHDQSALAAAADLAFSPRLLDHPDLVQMLEPMQQAFPAERRADAGHG